MASGEARYGEKHVNKKQWRGVVWMDRSREDIIVPRTIAVDSKCNVKITPDFQRTQPWYKHDCLSPILFAEGCLWLPSVAQNTPYSGFFFPSSDVFSISL